MKELLIYDETLNKVYAYVAKNENLLWLSISYLFWGLLVIYQLDTSQCYC